MTMFRTGLIVSLAASVAFAVHDDFGLGPLDDDYDYYDFIGGVLSEYQDAGASAIMECLTSDFNLAGLMLAPDPIAAALDAFSSTNYCSDSDKLTFQATLDQFETCSGYSINALTETFFGALVGSTMHCGKYLYDVGTTIMNTMNFGDEPTIEYPLPRMPNECVDALYGDNPFGNAFRLYSEFPEKDTECFAVLANDLPDCTLNQWPIPIVGMYLKAIACGYSKATPIFELSCNRELSALVDCLPEGDYSAEYQCTKAIQDCAAAELDAMSLESLMTLPPPLLGRPLSDTCQRVAKTDTALSPALTKYEAFREYCVAEEDKTIWDIKPTNTLTTTASMASQQVQESVPAVAAAAPPTANKRNNGGGGGTKVFFVGLLVGAAFAGMVAVAYGRRSQQQNRIFNRSNINYQYHEAVELA